MLTGWRSRLRDLPGLLGPQSLARRRAELPVALACAVLVLVALWLDLQTPRYATVAALLVLPPLVAGWLLRARYAAAVSALGILAAIYLLVVHQILLDSVLAVALAIMVVVGFAEIASTNVAAVRTAREREIRLLLELGAGLGAQATATEVYAETARLAALLIERSDGPAARGAVFRIDRGHPVLAAEYDRTDWRFPAEFDPRTLPGLVDAIGVESAFQRRTPDKFPSGVKHRAYAPIRVFGEQVAILAIGARESRPLTQSEMAIVAGMAVVAGLALQNVEAAARGRADALASFQDVTGRIVESLDIDETLAAVVRGVVGLADSDLAAIFLLDDEVGVLRVRQVLGQRSTRWAGYEQSATSGINGRALVTGEPQLVDDYLGLPDALPDSYRIAADENIRSIAILPLVRQGRPLGLMAAYRRRVAPYSENEVFLLRLLANQASIALGNALTYTELEEAKARSETLLRFSERLWEPLPVTDTARIVAEESRRALPGVEVMVFIVTPGQDDHFDAIAGAGPWAHRQVGRRIELVGTLGNRAMEERRPLETTDIQHANPNREMLASGGIDTARMVPLTSGSPLPDGRRSLGVIGYYRPGRRAYSPTERELMDELAIRAGLALHRAELLAAAQRAATRLQAGIELTVDLASALDSSEVIRRLLRRALVLLEADRSVLARVEGDQIAIDDAYDTEGRAAGVGERYEISFRPTVQQAIVSGQMAFGAPALFGLPDAVRAAYAEMRHTATCPLYLDGRIGAVLIVARKADRTFDSEDREMLSLLSNAAVIALRNANLYSQAQEAVRAKSDFLNLAAHELRTPLSVVNGYLSMLRDGSLGDPPSLWARPLAVMAGKVRELGQLVDDLLLAARLETGSVASGASTFDLRLVVREALARAEPRARLLDASVSHQMPSDAVLVSGDPEHVGRILDNLINNSLSYSPGRPWVRVSVIASRRPCVEVEDRGAGVPPEAREKIFERFFRGEGEGVTHPPGTGLGLYISRQLAERNGGALELVESEVGRGSTFRLTLPAPVAAVKPLEAAPPPA